MGQAHSGHQRIDARQVLARERAHGPRLLPALARDLRVEIAQPDLARLLVLDPREEHAHDAEGRRHHAARHRVHALGEHFHREDAVDEAAQRGRGPQVVVVRAAGVEADHEARHTDALSERVHVEGQVVGAALLAALDQDHAARVRHALLLERLDGRARGKSGIAVIRGATAVELVAPAHGRPRAEALAPADHLRLLVEVAVEKHGVVAAAGHLHVDDGRAAGEAHHLHAQAVDLARATPGLDQRHRAIDVAVRLPVGVEHGRLGRDLHVLGERGENVSIPRLLHEGQRLLRVEGHHFFAGWSARHTRSARSGMSR